ncbi:uncharacterized protein [Macrobrachium rosenbergii]|uniref:uncharacterized protein n=1 Tax=Macrobrachium rosenbergii TaxID=79674 RepID=UPI0034D53E94
MPRLREKGTFLFHLQALPSAQPAEGNLIQWRDPCVPLLCLKPSEPPVAPLPPRRQQEDLLPPGVSLGSIPWLQESLPAPQEAETDPAPATLLITGAAAALPSLARETLIEEQKADASTSRLRSEAATSEDALPDLMRDAFLLEDDLLCKVTRGPSEPSQVRHKLVVVPQTLQRDVLSLAHDGISGHFGVARTARAVESKFYWPGIRKSVKQFVASCPTCQVAGNPNEVVPRAPIRNIPSAGVPFRDVVIDYFTPQGRMKSKSGNAHCLTIIDRFTRYPEAIPVRSESSKNAVKALVKFFCRFGFPATIQTDQGRHFMSKEFRDGMASHGIRHFHSTPYHPESQGIIERFHQSLSTTLTKLEHEGGGSWEDNLPYALFAARHAPSETTGYSPFELLYAHSTRAPLDILYDAWADPTQMGLAAELPTIQKNLRAAWAVAQATEAATQERVKMKFDKAARSRSFETGDQVLVLRTGATRPLETHFSGPHKVLGRRGDLNYLVDCGKRRAKWLHINLLKPYRTRGEETPEDGASNSEAVVGAAALAYQPTANSEILESLEVITPGLDAAHREDIRRLLSRNSRVVRDTLGCTGAIQHSISIKEGVKPIAQGYYRVNPDKARRIEEQVQLQLDLGLIEQSHSPWASPVVLVPKEGGGDRLCVDYRKLNEATESEPYPLPRIEACLDSLGSAPYLSKIDLEKGYWQVPLSEESLPDSVHNSQRIYQCKVMPFGLKNAPSCFQPVDASDIGIGAVMFQEKEGVRHPVAYYAKKLKPAETRYSTIEKELLGMVLAMKHFESYHADHTFPLTVYTDHNPYGT